MLRSVPTGISCFLGTITVSTTDSDCRTKLHVAALLTDVCKACSMQTALSRANLNLNQPDLRWAGRLWWFEIEFQSFLEIGQRFSLGFPLACDIQLKTLGDVPIAFSPNACRKGTLHT